MAKAKKGYKYVFRRADGFTALCSVNKVYSLEPSTMEVKINYLKETVRIPKKNRLPRKAKKQICKT